MGGMGVKKMLKKILEKFVHRKTAVVLLHCDSRPPKQTYVEPKTLMPMK